MIRLFTLAIVFLLGLLSSSQAANIAFTAYSPNLGVERGIWQISTASQIPRVVARNIDNPRACYYLINQAYRVGLEVETAVALKPFADKQPFDPEMQAIYAYACLVGTSRALTSGSGKVLDAVTKSNLFSEQSASFSNLRLTMQRYPKSLLKSPEATVMAAACYEDKLYSESIADHELWNKLKSWSLQATKSAPKWADTHFRYGSVLISYARTGDLRLPPSTQQNALIKSKRELLVAQGLDSSNPMTGSCAKRLGLNAYAREQYGEALQYIDIWFKYLPEYSRVDQLKVWRQSIVNLLRSKR